jgi:hypothetical protein
MKLKKMTTEYKASVIKALDIATKVSDLSSDYYWLFVNQFNIEGKHVRHYYDGLNNDITSLFVEGITYKELCNSWGKSGGRMPFLKNHPKYAGFTVDPIASVIHAKGQSHTPEDKFYMLQGLFALALRLEYERITDEIILKSKNYLTRTEKS